MNIPGYRILREIGKGNMAIVYLATQESLDRQVALKVMSSALVEDPSFRRRFLQEGQIIAQVSHPHIVTVYDIASYEDKYYLALEYAAGGSLSNRAAQLGYDESVDLIKQVASALGYAHSRGFVHRDVKPGNVLFREDGFVLLSDFGIAKALDNTRSQLTHLGTSIGTPRYMSPEQASGKPVTPQSDLYSLGVMFYELLAGHPLFEADTPLAVAIMHLHNDPPALPPSCAEFQPVISRLLAKAPEQRYANAAELIRAIDEVQTSHRKIITDSRKDRIDTGRGATGAAQHPAGRRETLIRPAADGVGVLRQEEGLPEPPSIMMRVVTAPRRLLGAVAHGFSTRVPAIQHGLAVIAKWAPALGAFVLAVGLTLYALDTLFGARPVDLSARTLHPSGPADYVNARHAALQDVVLAYRQLVAVDANNSVADGMAKDIARDYEQLARSSWEQGNRQLALSLVNEGLGLAPDHTGLARLKEEIGRLAPEGGPGPEQRQEITRWLEAASKDIAASRFILPKGNNAVESYRRVLQIDPGQKEALNSLDALAARFASMGRSELYNGDTDQARLRMEQGLMISPTNKGLLTLRDLLTKMNDDVVEKQ